MRACDPCSSPPHRYPSAPYIPLQSSKLLAANTKAVDEACQPAGEAPSVSGGTYAATYWVQLQQLLGRQMTRYWRMPQVGGLAGMMHRNNKRLSIGP